MDAGRESGGKCSVPGEGWWQLRPVGSSRGGKKWPNLGYTLMIKLTTQRPVQKASRRTV